MITLERTASEILLHIPSHVDIKELQDMLDYFKYKEATMNSKATQEDADSLAKQTNKAILKRFNALRAVK